MENKFVLTIQSYTDDSNYNPWLNDVRPATETERILEQSASTIWKYHVHCDYLNLSSGEQPKSVLQTGQW